MKFTKPVTVLTIAILALSSGSALAARSHRIATKGTLSYTDATPDETPTAGGDATNHCSTGTLPSAPTDVNSQPVKLASAGTLTVMGHNISDWAMEIHDPKGNTITGSDGSLPTDAEGATAFITKPGTYAIVYCNLGGEPTTTADWSFKATK
ncbi:MAG: hypothetical protein QOC87_55 [Actinomycetota bacterium]|jgi:hypothetical protein|nr:hypothetical protein [Actinomycetota bacterium]